MQDYNFFSAYKVKGKVSTQKTLIVALVAVVVLGIMGGFYAVTQIMASSLHRDISSMQTFLSSKETLQKVSEVEKKKKSMEIMSRYENVVDTFIAYINRNDKVKSSLMEDLNKTLPQDILFTNMNVTQKDIKLQGEANGWTSIAELEHNLNALGIFSQVRVNTIQAASDGGARFTFDAECTLKDVIKP